MKLPRTVLIIMTFADSLTQIPKTSNLSDTPPNVRTAAMLTINTSKRMMQKVYDKLILEVSPAQTHGAERQEL